MRYLVFFFLFTAFLHSYSQVKVEATPTGKHAKALNTAKQTRAEAKERKQQAKEVKKQVREHKKAKMHYQKRFKELKQRQLETQTTNELDSLQVPQLSKEDSLVISNEVLKAADFPPEYRELILNPPTEVLEQMKAQPYDSLALNKGERLAEQVAKEHLPGELEAPDDPLGDFKNPLNESGEMGLSKPSKPNPNLIKPEAAKALFKQIDAEQFQKAQAEIQKLKKKYSELPDTRFPEEGTKRNSLENSSFAKRLFLGGNVSLTSTDPLIVSSDLKLGYWINKKWLAGAGVILREQFTGQDSTSLVSGDGHGFSLFTRCDIPKGFFAWAESEFQINRSLFDEATSSAAKWQQAHLIGIGREFKVSFARMMSIVMYDFNYRNNNLNPRPLVFKIGVQFTKKPE